VSAGLIIRPEAEADVRDAFAWYEERLPGLGVSFLDELELAFDSISAMPEAHAKVHRKMRRALLRRCPYGILYVLEPGSVVVLAILHTSRNPSTWTRRAGSRRGETR
jgi:plasmid stabilization system protein ParE